jgi:uncharacterized protein (DUF427 family)
VWDTGWVSTRVRDAMMQRLRDLRHEPIDKRIRAVHNGETVVDSTRALLVWEPRRVVPLYAVPTADVRGELVPSAAEPVTSDARVLHPGIPFAAHSTEGESLDVRAAGSTLGAAAFRPADEDLADHVVLDFSAFDEWYEEDEPVFSHPRDPFHRVDTRRSSRSVRIELDGVLLAESNRPMLLFETSLPTRFYLPREDVVADLERGDKVTRCPYKGEATHWSVGEHRNVAWSYEDPLEESVSIRGLVAFYDDRVDVTLDDERREYPRTEIAQAVKDEFSR